MARLDRLIQALHGQRADTLDLTAGKPASLVRAGQGRPVTKDPLSGEQVVQLVREIAPPDQVAHVGRAWCDSSTAAPAAPCR